MFMFELSRSHSSVGVGVLLSRYLLVFMHAVGESYLIQVLVYIPIPAFKAAGFSKGSLPVSGTISCAWARGRNPA